MIYCMMQWIKGGGGLLQNNQNRKQNKLVNKVNGNDLIKHNYWPYLYFGVSEMWGGGGRGGVHGVWF